MRRLLFDYSHTYDPAAPVIEVEVVGYQPASRRITQIALVDSGADATMMPRHILRQVGAEFLETRRMRGVIGVSQRVRVYIVAIHIGEQVLHGVRVAELAAGDETILGRNVLNQLRLTLDGLGSQTTVEFYNEL